MFTLRKEAKPSKFDDLIDDIIMEMKGLEATSEDYQTLLVSMKMLLEAKAQEPAPAKVDPNTTALIAGNLAGIIMVLIFEKRNVITSKSMSLAIKPKMNA